MLNFVQNFADLLPDYEISCEHEHSNCVLIAHKKVLAIIANLAHNTTGFFTFLQFKIDGKWCTWIDYQKFHELVGIS